MKRKHPDDAAIGWSGNREPREVELRLFKIDVKARGIGVTELEDIDALEQGRAFCKKGMRVQLKEDVAGADPGARRDRVGNYSASELGEDFKDGWRGKRGVNTKKKSTKTQRHKDGSHG
jgi:hypothetical protein